MFCNLVGSSFWQHWLVDGFRVYGWCIWISLWDSTFVWWSTSIHNHFPNVHTLHRRKICHQMKVFLWRIDLYYWKICFFFLWDWIWFHSIGFLFQSIGIFPLEKCGELFLLFNVPLCTNNISPIISFSKSILICISLSKNLDSRFAKGGRKSS